MTSSVSMRPPAACRPLSRSLSTLAGVAVAASLLGFASAALAEPVREASTARAADPVEELIVDVVSSHPHDPTAFTQGLVWTDGVLYESTGQYGQSTLRRVDPESGEVLARVELPPELFGEGLALLPGETGGRLIQITWQEQVARQWSLPGLKPTGSFPYRGEGWGLCFDGRRLVMSDGGDHLTFRDPETFEVTGRVQVTLRGEPLQQINELECVDGQVWANVLGADYLVRIDPATGRVTAVADASGLLAPAEAARADVLNGIAYDPERRVYLITGKYWPRLFVVRLVKPRAGSDRNRRQG